ncbi:MAG: hypothetical protein IPN39_00115 [Chitinophagaceae bacterium]|nr:hypothetical protein [Chitinophagaceae bacterium]MBK9379721.1 hypothetical protein [Chitinophagaceae bacterium]MBP8114425.1 hypothetical protein [Chitinophagaceae bacterium]MBP9104942.1 hypothetical protein [Chitinophagaceae bacterium]
MLMPGRTYTTGDGYRYSINGQEKTPEIAPNTTTAEFWQYDARIVRRWNVDPKPNISISPYAAFRNNPILFIDPLGDTTINGQKYEPNNAEHGTVLQEVVLSPTISKVPKKPITPEYFDKFRKVMNRQSTRRMLTGLSTVGNRLFGSPYDPFKITRLKEPGKQEIFKQSANQTIAILFYEFVEGTGSQRRDFDETTSITQQIANSYTTSLFFDYFYPLYQSGAFNDGVERLHTVFTSPDNANSIKEWVKAHGQLFWNPSAFFTGSLDYNFKIEGNKLLLRVHNEFSISSGDPQSRNKADDLHRVPGHDSPLGNTQQYFNFSVDLDKLKRN